MPALVSDEEIGLAFDMHGCPNRCRHCWLDHEAVASPRTRMSEDDVRWAVAQFRAFRRPGEDRPPWRGLKVATWIREEDYSDDYRRLHALEAELSDTPYDRGKIELLSAWRLARDAEYAAWGHSLGVREAQLTFFGLEKTTDWGWRRRGAFRDLLVATERLLAAGIRPRWQVFFLKPTVPDLPGLIALAGELRLRERCEPLGAPFTLWMHLPTPDGAALGLEPMRPTERDLDRVPRAFLEQSEARLGRPIGRPERIWLRSLRDECAPALRSVSEATSGNPLLFYVAPGFDVYLSFFSAVPAFRLGNLRTDGVAAILDTWENDRTPGLRAMFCTPTRDLAQRYGHPHGHRLYDEGDLPWLWGARLAREKTETAPEPRRRQGD